MKLRVEAENIERVKANMESLIEVVNKGNRASVETHKAMNTVGTEMRGRLREQNLLINSWRVMHPQLSLLTRGLSNVATVGHILTNAFQALNIMQLRQRQSANDLKDATQDATDKELVYQKVLKKFGDELHPEVMKAKNEWLGAIREVVKVQDQLKADKWQDFGTQLGVVMSLFSIPANVLNSMAAFKSLDIKDKFVTNLTLTIAALKGLSLVQLGQIGLLIAGIVLSIDKLATVITGESPLKKLAIDLGLVTATDTTRLEEIRDLIKDIAVIEMDPFNIELAKTKQHLKDLFEFKRGLQEKSTTTKTTFLDDLFKQLGLPTDQDILNALTRFGIIAGSPLIPSAAGETGGGIPQNEPSQLPFGKGGAIGEFPARPPTFGEKATQLATEAINTEAQRDRELANVQSNLDTIEQQINTEVKSIIPNTGRPSERLLNLVAEQSRLESARTELNNIIGRREDARRFKDLTGIDLDTYNRVAKIASREGVSIADVSPNIGVRLGLTPSLGGGGGLVGNRVSGIGGIADYEKLFGKDIALLGSVGIGGRQVSAEEYRIQRDIADGRPIVALDKGGGYYQPSAININPDVASRTAREKFVAGMYGFAGGGIINEPVIGTGLNTGRGYSFGESGPETITPGRGAGGMVVNVYVSGSLIAEADLIRKVSEGIARRVQGLV